MIEFVSLLAAVIPIGLYAFFLWKFDKYDPEPIGLYLKNFFWGAFGAVILAIIGTESVGFIVSFFIHDPIAFDQFQTIISAPFVEEFTKGVFLFGTVLSRKFDNTTDGIVYGGAIGFGFGMTENFLYFISYTESLESWIFLVIIRTLFTAVMHCVSTATFGAFLGYAKFSPPIKKFTMPFIGFFVAVFIHSAWNFSVSFESTTLIGGIFLVFTIGLFIAIFRMSVSNESKMIYKELSEESDLGLIPFQHLHILNSELRNKLGWIDESIRKEYVKSAITLAFRKMQERNSTGFNRLFYQSEIFHFRNKIRDILNIQP